MNYEELEEALDELFPNGFSIETDNNGQLIIHTGLIEDEEGELVAADIEEDEEVDPDLDHLDDDELDEDE